MQNKLDVVSYDSNLSKRHVKNTQYRVDVGYMVHEVILTTLDCNSLYTLDLTLLTYADSVYSDILSILVLIVVRDRFR